MKRRLKLDREAKILAVVCVVVAAGLWAWPRLQDIRGGFGDPTPLLPGETPLAAVCRLRQEFLALPEPVFEGFDWHERWSRVSFSAGANEYGPYWEIKPTRATRDFTRAHSRLEIVAAVGPFTNDPVLSHKAAAVLAALPVRSRAALREVQTYAHLVAEEKVWDIYDWRNVHSTLGDLFGLENSTGWLEERELDEATGTLEGAIYEVLAVQQSLPGVLFPETDFGSSPEPVAEFLDFMHHWPRDWLATVLFPLATMQSPRGSSGFEQAMWVFGLEARYWRLLVDDIEVDPAITTDAFREEVGSLARAVCTDGKPRT